jgi:hypothetical protein
MSGKPIIFSGPMIRALLEGRKTQTRRVMKPPYGIFESVGGELRPMHIKVSPGDRLWVREAFADMTLELGQPWEQYNAETRLYERETNPFVWYRADGEPPDVGDGRPLPARWRPSIHMPRWASRITLIVTDVRVQRVQDISEEDAIAEGVPTNNDYAGSFAKEYCHHCGGSGVHGAFGAGYGVTEVDCAECETATLRLRNLWNHLHGPGAWEANPWVAAYTFTVHHCNIDATPKEPGDG